MDMKIEVHWIYWSDHFDQNNPVRQIEPVDRQIEPVEKSTVRSQG